MTAPDRYADDDRGATPLRLAAEANSAAHHAVDELREFTRRQGERNVTLEQKIDDQRKDVDERLREHGEQLAGIAGSVKTMAWLFGVAIVVVPMLFGATFHFAQLIK